MGATAWDYCPQCRDENERQIDEILADIDNQYGELSPDEWLSFKRFSEDKIDEIRTESKTFRENYEIYGAGDGMFIVWYEGYCTKCKLSHEFKHEEVFYG